MAEVIKHGIISGHALLARIQKKNLHLDVETIRRALQVKIDIVEQDPKEQTIRAHLNLGHTFGHAIEKVSNFEIPHGEAVGLGLIAANHLALQLDPESEDLSGLLEQTLTAFGLPTRAPALAMADLLKALETDKKKHGSTMRFIVPLRPGQMRVAAVSDKRIIQESFSKILP